MRTANRPKLWNLKSFLLSFILGGLLLHFIQPAVAQSIPSRNDHIFPSAPEAKPFIDFDKKGFIINGKRTFIVSAGIEYARVPRGLWYDRLLKLKRAGFNAVEVYTFWNYHEPREGEFDFSGDQDLEAFLKLVNKMEMYAIVRVGPYYCGEWNLGGFPIWLKFKPGLRVRENNPQFLTAVGNFFNKLIPIVARNQVNHGGPVIMVQLENEHRAAWGTVTPNDYFRFLIDKTVSLGLQVPYFFSGLHPGNDPAGNLKSLDDPERPNPWFSTEYWGIWFSNYGPQPQDSTIYDRRTWKIIARGGNGYNVYMAHGGTNFAYNNDRDMAASYDYGAAVGQTGDLRPIYYGFKRAAWFARSFQDILANSSDETSAGERSSVSDTSFIVNARKSPSGTITFFDNNSVKSRLAEISPPESLNIRTLARVDIDAGEIMPVVHDFPLTKEISLAWAPARIYRVLTQGNLTTLVVYGDAGSSVKLFFKSNSNAVIGPLTEAFNLRKDGILEFSSSVPSEKPAEYWFKTVSGQLRILVLDNEMVRRSWFADWRDQTNILVGPAYAGELVAKGRHLRLVTERSWQDSSDVPVWIFKPSGKAMQMVKGNGASKHPLQLEHTEWKFKSASQPAAPEYDDSSWIHSKEPLQMGADGDISAYAWYRTNINVPETGRYTLRFKDIRERAIVFLNGNQAGTIELSKKSIDLDISGKQTNNLAIFTSHTGRNKQIFYVGPLDIADPKGLSGPATLQKSDGSGPEIQISDWKMKGGPGMKNSRHGWKPLPAPGSIEPAFFKTTFSLPELKNVKPVWRVITTSLSYGSVWVNGHNLGRYPEKIKINGLYIPENWLKKRNNTLVIFDENGVLPRQVEVRAEIAAGRDVAIYSENDRFK